MRWPVWVTCAAMLAASATNAAPRRGKRRSTAKPAPSTAEDTPKPQAPQGNVRKGPSGSVPAEGDGCPKGQLRVPAGVVLRKGPGVNFGVTVLAEQERCLPRIRQAVDGTWVMVELAQGKSGWFQAGSAVLATGQAAPLPPGNVLFEVQLTDDVVFQQAPSLLAPVTAQGRRSHTVQVHNVSADGLFYLCADNGKPLGWVLKTMTRNTTDASTLPGGGKPWAPPPQPLERLPAGSPDVLFNAPPPLPSPASQPALETAATAPSEPAAASSQPQVAAPTPPPSGLDYRKLSGIALLAPRPVGRGLTLGVGLAPTYFYQRFQSNAFNDPLGNYRLDNAMAGLLLDAEYHAGLGLVVGARLQSHLYAYTDFVPPPLRQLPEPIGNPKAAEETVTPRCPYPLPAGPLRSFCPLPATVQMLQLYGGWRIHSSDSMDVALRMAYSSELLLFGKPGSREPFADLWYHGLKPSVKVVFRPWAGRFGAFATEMAMGVGVVIPMILRARPSCTALTPGGCVLQPRDILESTYRLDEDTGIMKRTGYARPPFHSGVDLRGGYLFEMPFFQLDVGVQAMVRYYAVFYTSAEGFSKRNRCCDRGYYDRASNLDVYIGPSLMGRAAF